VEWDSSVRFGARRLALRAIPAVVRARGRAAERARRAEAPEVDEKNCETNPITSAGILAKLAWSEAGRYGCRGEVRAGGARRLALLFAWFQDVPGSRALVKARAAPHGA
jgi:hypothetical protein